MYDITLRNVVGAPHEMKPPRAFAGGHTFKRGVTVSTTSRTLANWARNQGQRFYVRVDETAPAPAAKEKGSRPKKSRAKRAAAPGEASEETNIQEAWAELWVGDEKPRNSALLDFAVEHAIDLDGASRKDEMIATIESFLDGGDE